MPKVAIEKLSLELIGNYPDSWAKMTLSDVCSQVTDGTHDSPKEVEEGFPLVTGKAIKNRRIDFSIPYNISEEDHLKVIARSKPERDDILFANIGNSIGDLVRVQSDSDFSIKNVALFKPNREIIEPRYLEYYLFSDQVQSFIKNSTRGSAQPFIGLSTLRGFPVAVPPKTEQYAIANLLGALDDKIELNRQINTTLESMAQALFKSWFVDFDPVIDNALAAGNPIPEPLMKRAQARAQKRQERHAAAQATQSANGSTDASPLNPLPAEIQQLFPSSFVFTEEMGWVPEGWSCLPVYNIANFINGAAFKSEHFSDKGEGLPVVKIAELKNGMSGQTKFTEQSFDEKYKISDGDILFSWSGNPDTSIDTFIWLNGDGWLNQHIFKVSLLEDGDYSYVFTLLKHLKPMFAEIARDKQTTGLGHVTAGDMKRLNVVSPSPEARLAFNKFAGQLFKRRNIAVCEVNSLTRIRDSLLPKLLSGQIHIPEAEQQLAEVI